MLESTDIPVPIPIIILNWNGINDTIECVESVLNLKEVLFQVYLVDNNSADGSQEILKNKYESCQQIKLIFNKENFGFTKGNNRVLKVILSQSTYSQYIALLNNDTVVDPYWLSNLYSSALQYRASIISSKMINYFDRNTMDNAGHQMLNTGEILPIGHGHSIHQFEAVFENMGACAGAGLYSTKMLSEIGLFDEYFSTGYEDAELGVRAVMTGHKCIYEPSAIVYHKMGQSIKKVFNEAYAIDMQRKISYAYFKLMPSGNILINFPFYIIRLLFILLILGLLFRFKQAKIVLKSIRDILITELPHIRQARSKFLNKISISTFSITKKQTFFLKNHIDRLFYFFSKNRQSALDVYGKK